MHTEFINMYADVSAQMPGAALHRSATALNRAQARLSMRTTLGRAPRTVDRYVKTNEPRKARGLRGLVRISEG